MFTVCSSIGVCVWWVGGWVCVCVCVCVHVYIGKLTNLSHTPTSSPTPTPTPTAVFLQRLRLQRRVGTHARVGGGRHTY